VAAPATLAELALLCDVIALCVSADADVLGVVREIAAHARPHTIVIDHSTVSPETAKQAHKLMREAGGDFLDAPVSGGVEGAKNGKLSVMAGGDAETLARVRPMLDAYAAKIGHMGAVGAGQSTKAVNQVLVAGIAQGVCEGLALGEALGLNPAVLLPTLSNKPRTNHEEIAISRTAQLISASSKSVAIALLILVFIPSRCTTHRARPKKCRPDIPMFTNT